MNIQFPAAFEDCVKKDLFLGKDLLDSTSPVSVRFYTHKTRSLLDIDHAVSLYHAASFYPKEAGLIVLDAHWLGKKLTMNNYQNEPLAWVKHLGNRFNNVYPKEWRICMIV